MPIAKNPNQPTRQYDVSNHGHSTFPLFIGEVMDVTDVEVLHRVSVYIPDLGGRHVDIDFADKHDKRNWIVCQITSPLLGSTNRIDTTDTESYMSTQKSYGLFLPIPDINVTVIVGFPNGDISQAIVLGTIPDAQRTFTIPGIPFTTTTDADGGSPIDVPGAERNWRHRNYKETHRPTHDPMMDYLIKQGLDLDGVRGTSTSGTHRAYPYPTKAYGLTTPAQHHFVMDDGHTVQGVQEKAGPKPWWNPKPGSKGQEDCLVRIRTASGAQILLHDTESLMYFITPDGTTWIELSDKEGKIDIYAQGDISINAEGSINLRSGDKIAIEAVNEIDIKSLGKDGIKLEALTGGIDIRSKLDYNVTSDANGNILIKGNYKEQATRIDMNGPTPTTAAKPEVFPLACNKSITSSICDRVPEHEPWACHDPKEGGGGIRDPITVKPYGGRDTTPSEIINRATARDRKIWT